MLIAIRDVYILYVTGNVWNQAFYRMPRHSIECLTDQAFYRIPRYSIECLTHQEFYRIPRHSIECLIFRHSIECLGNTRIFPTYKCMLYKIMSTDRHVTLLFSARLPCVQLFMFIQSNVHSVKFSGQVFNLTLLGQIVSGFHSESTEYLS